MAMKPIEIANRDFAKKFSGGYDPVAVRTFLSQVGEEVHQLQSELIGALQQLDQLKQEAGRNYREENTIARVMLEAEQAALRTRREAEQDAQTIRERASRDAQSKIQAAKEEADLIVRDAKTELRRLDSRVAILRRVLTDNVDQAMGLLNGAVGMLMNVRDNGASLPEADQGATPTEEVDSVLLVAEPMVSGHEQ